MSAGGIFRCYGDERGAGHGPAPCSSGEGEGRGYTPQRSSLPAGGQAGVIRVDFEHTDVLNCHHVLHGTQRKPKPRERMFLSRWQSQTDHAAV